MPKPYAYYANEHTHRVSEVLKKQQQGNKRRIKLVKKSNPKAVVSRKHCAPTKDAARKMLAKK